MILHPHREPLVPGVIGRPLRYRPAQKDDEDKYVVVTDDEIEKIKTEKEKSMSLSCVAVYMAIGIATIPNVMTDLCDIMLETPPALVFPAE